MTTEPAAVPVEGGVFTTLALLFLLGMVAVVVWRIVAKSRAARLARRRGDGGNVHTADAGGRDKDGDGGTSDGADGGGGDGGGGGD